MASYNKVILLGNLTRDPEMRTLPSGARVAIFSLGVNRKYRTQQGEVRDESCFVDIEMFAALADLCERYLHKGDPVLIEGLLKQDTWEKDGQKRSKLKVVGTGMQLMPKSGGKGQNSDEGGYRNQDSSSSEIDEKIDIPL